MATRAFTRAARRQAENTRQAPVPFELRTGDPLLDDDGEEMYDANGDVVLDPDTIHTSVLTANPPTPEQLALALAMGASEFATLADEMGAALELFRSILSKEDYRVLIRRLRDPRDEVDLSMLSQIVEWLVEQWQDFPTQPQSASSRSEKPSGPRSTGRSPGKGSTRST